MGSRVKFKTQTRFLKFFFVGHFPVPAALGICICSWQHLVFTHGRSSVFLGAQFLSRRFSRFREWEDWANCLLGLKISALPCILGLEHTAGMRINLAVGHSGGSAQCPVRGSLDCAPPLFHG